MENLERYLTLAENVARQAGEVLRKAQSLEQQVNDDSGRDVKLQADLDSEKLIRSLLSEQSDFPVIGEEQGGDAGLLERSEPYWVVDPLDGTYNYLRGVPLCCVSIGLMRGADHILGVVFDFNRTEMFSGGPGLGLRLNGTSVTPQWAKTADQATLQTGFTSAQDYSLESLGRFIVQVRGFKKTRAIGSAALAMAWTAFGRSDVYHESAIRLWDIAGAAALILAAGGSIRLESLQKPAFAYNVWAGVEDFFPPA